MRPSVHPITVRFLANQRLVVAARNKASREGMTLSEFLRQAVREQVREVA